MACEHAPICAMWFCREGRPLKILATEGGRANDLVLDRPLPLVRFPQMKSIVPPMAEPLFMGHPLTSQLLGENGECHASFAT